MIKFNHIVLREPDEKTGNEVVRMCEPVEFHDESEMAEFIQKLNAEALALRKGDSSIKEQQCVEVLVVGNEIYVDVVAHKFPSFAEWKCALCNGQRLKCSRCKGEGWDPERVNEKGQFVKKVRVGDHSMFMLIETHVYEEMS